MSLASTFPGLLSSASGYTFAETVFGEAGTVDAYLQFEAALACTEAELGIIPREAASSIAGVCRRELLDIKTLREQASLVGYPIVPLIDMLAELAGEHGQWIHFGTTTQDVMDTAMILQIRRVGDFVIREALDVEQLLSRLCQEHRRTPMAGRSKLQHGTPISFGYKVAVWLDQLHRTRLRLSSALQEAYVLQFGGANGTLSCLKGEGTKVRRLLATKLELTEPDISWHVNRDRIAALSAAVSALHAALAKVALDIALMASTEVGELCEPFASGRGSSSTMPQKRNPVICEAIIEAAREAQHTPALILDAMLQEHERGIGHAYRERTALCRDMTQLAGTISLASELLSGIEVDTGRMKQNLDATEGLIYAEAIMIHLSQTLGRIKAHHLLAELSRKSQNRSPSLSTFQDAGIKVPEHLFSAEMEIEAAQPMIDLVLEKTGSIPSAKANQMSLAKA